MSWTRGLLSALAVCALLGGSAGCGSSGAHERRDGVSASPVGKLLDNTDEEGRHYREIGKKGAPKVAIEVRPDSGDRWDVRLTVKNFRFSPAGTSPVAVAGRGIAVLYLDGRTVARLRAPEYDLAGDLVPRGTHHVTARLYADDRTVWAVSGTPIESTADITASETGTTRTPAQTSTQSPTQTKPPESPTQKPAQVSTQSPTPTMSGSSTEARTDTGGSPDPGGKAS